MATGDHDRFQPVRPRSPAYPCRAADTGTAAAIAAAAVTERSMTAAQALDHDPIGLNRIMISSLCLSMISGQTSRVCPEEKPVPTFPDHA